MTAAKNVTEEFNYLMEKANRKFSRLRDLPPYGRGKWDVYFHKAFHVYANLWKFQQEHRAKLVESGLKRWEIGEIASRIGQLYYTYYLRTSESSFLHEAYVFYEAIGSREYFKEAAMSDVALANKQLRYIARFIMVCLLLNRRDMIRRLLHLFRSCVDDYRHNFQHGDGKEWKNLLQEVAYFMKSDSICECVDSLRFNVLLEKNNKDFLSLKTLTLKHDAPSLKLRDAIFTSFHVNEIIFTDLSLDIFRMIQTMEYEPKGIFFKSKKLISEPINPLSEPPLLASEPPNPASETKAVVAVPNPNQTETNSEALTAKSGSDPASISSVASTLTTTAKKSKMFKSQSQIQLNLTAQEMIRDQTLPPNPHKTYLFHPSVTHLLSVLANAIDELPPNSILLFYISGSGCTIEPQFFEYKKKIKSEKSLNSNEKFNEINISLNNNPNGPDSNSKYSSNPNPNSNLKSNSISNSNLNLNAGDPIKNVFENLNDMDSEMKARIQIQNLLKDEHEAEGKKEGKGMDENEGETKFESNNNGNGNGNGHNDNNGEKEEDHVQEKKKNMEEMIHLDTKGIWFGLNKESIHNTFYPRDLIPFLRRPIFLIVDCDNSDAFQVLSSCEISEPVVMLLSPLVPSKPTPSKPNSKPKRIPTKNPSTQKSNFAATDYSASEKVKNEPSYDFNPVDDDMATLTQNLPSDENSSSISNDMKADNDSMIKEIAGGDLLKAKYDDGVKDHCSNDAVEQKKDDDHNDASDDWKDMELSSTDTILPSGTAGGNLFTLFLSSPLLALCDLCEIPTSKIASLITEDVDSLLCSIFFRWSYELYKCSNLNFAFSRLLGDVFLRQYILRFIFCRACFELHQKFQNASEQHFPKCFPELPEDVNSFSDVIISGMKEIAVALDLTHHFRFPH